MTWLAPLGHWLIFLVVNGIFSCCGGGRCKDRRRAC